jgi:putative ABC transport system permease protein
MSVRTLRRAWHRAIGFFTGGSAEREFAAELESHLDMHVADNICAGMTPEAARRHAAMKLGTIAAVSESQREQRGLPRLESLVQDVRHCWRGLRRNPGFALACIGTLALGIGINSAIFSVVNGVLFAPLPYAAPDRLISIWTRHPEVHNDLSAMSAANALDLKRMVTTVSQLEALQANVIPATLIVNGEGVPAQGVLMTPGMFSLLGREPLLGRSLRDGDRSDSIVLSYACWQRQFSGDTSVVGRSVGDGARALTIVGVMPKEFVFPYPSMLRAPVSFTSSAEVDFWVALPDPTRPRPGTTASPEIDRTARLFAVVARLNDGRSLEEASADIAVAWRQLAQAYPGANAGWETAVVPLHDQAVAPVRATMLLLLSGVGVVLLIACVNVANLLLARSVARQRELALRAALGAGRARLLQQVLTESLVLSVTGATVGLLFARWATPVLVSLAPPATPRLSEIATDWTVVLFATTISVVCGLVVGLLPGLGASRVSLRTTIGDGTRGSSDNRRRLRGVLVAAEVGLAVVLAVGAGLLMRSFLSVLAVDPGFKSENLLTMGLNVPGHYDTAEKRLDFLRQLFARLEAVPGVVSVGGVTRLPLGGANSSTQVAVEGRVPPEGQWPEADFRRALHRYFETMGIPLRRGRIFDDRDRADAPGVVVINETFARRIFGNEDPIGRQIRLGSSSPVRQATIIGIVGDLRHQRLDAAPAAEVYVHYLQAPPVAPLIVIRTSSDAARLAPAIRSAARESDAGVRPYSVRTMADLRTTSTLDRRFLMGLVMAFGVLALVLAAVGVYGVMTLVVAERRREMGIRLALGAAPRGLVALVVGQALKLALIGGVTGSLAAIALSPLIANQLYGVGATDPITIGAVLAVLCGVALVASWMPARRVLRVDPVTALRCD